MRKFSCRVLIASVLVFLLAVPRAWGWGSPGHMAVAYIAWQNLKQDPALAARIQKLLKLNPNYSVWKAYLPAGASRADSDTYIFMMAATWPDEIKAIHSYISDGPNHGDTPPTDPAKANRNLGYSKDKYLHKYWHFIDQPISPDHTSPADIPAPNVETQINLFRTVIASDASDPLKSYDLVWLLHLVGDIHQPLHCAARFISSKSDGGGNDVVLAGAPFELHGYWDSLPGLGGTKNFKKAVTFASALPAADATKASDKNVHDWVQESFALAETDAYRNPPINSTNPAKASKISSTYASTALEDAQSRVALAGARLALLIRENLK